MPSGGGMNHRCRSGRGQTRFSPAAHPANPRLTHRCSTTTQALPTCGTPAPASPAGQPSCAEDCATLTGSSSSHLGRLLHRRPHHSRQTGLLHRMRLSRHSGLLLPPSAAPLAPSRPPLPSAAPLCAKPVSDPSTKRRHTGQKQPSATPSASHPSPPCLR
uniref:Uncharacterized protein n=1 Tax=Oryza sativa subsp. japonica TaxID=39947 RepID=Q6Z723_ORYSJ|nr:hypothetical protein [Oryza sativa Japonica Group]